MWAGGLCLPQQSEWDLCHCMLPLKERDNQLSHHTYETKEAKQDKKGKKNKTGWGKNKQIATGAREGQRTTGYSKTA